MNNVFLNIIVLFSPNYKNNNVVGTVTKCLSRMEQFIFFYKSIKLNLKLIKYDISIAHFKDFNNEDLNKLNEMNVNLIKINTETLRACALERYIVKTRIKGTHRLLAETDMLFLKEPNFNWDVDFQKMYAGPIEGKNVQQIERIFNIRNKYIKNYNINDNPFISYNIKKINKNEIYPHFNNGLTLIKEEFSKEFYKKGFNFFKKLNKHICHDLKINHHFADQVLYGLLLLELTDNWEPFEPGINFLYFDKIFEKFGRENISLLHYAGTDGAKLAQQKFPEYFK